MEARSFFLERRGLQGKALRHFARGRVRGIALCGGSVEGVCAVREGSACGIALCEGWGVGGVCCERRGCVAREHSLLRCAARVHGA